MEDDKTLFSSSEDLKNWISFHPELSNFLNIYQYNSQEHSQADFSEIRSSKICRSIDTVKEYIEKLLKRQNLIKDRLSDTCDSLSLNPKPVFYDLQEQNLTCRKMYFLDEQIKLLKIRMLEKEFTFLETRINIATDILYLLMSQYIPSNIAVSLNEIQLFVDFTQGNEDDKIQRLTAKYEYYKNLTDSFEKPLWETDMSGFIKKMIDTINYENPRLEKFFPENELEVSFSRALFVLPKSELGAQFDAFLSKIALKALKDFKKSVLKFCKSVYESKNNRENDIAFNVLYRALCGRIYERFPSLFAPMKNDQRNMFIHVCNMKVTEFDLAEWIEAKIDTSLSFRNAVSTIPMIMKNAEMLIPMIFRYDGYSLLNDFKEVMVSLQNFLKQIGDDPTVIAVSFDEMFPVLLSVIISSDVCNIFEMFDMVQLLKSTSYRANELDFAATNLEGVCEFIKSTYVSNK